MTRPDHSCDRHNPGTAYCYYSEGCRCWECSFAGSEYAREKRSVDSLKVPYSVVRPMFTALRSRGWSYRQIAAATGLATSTLVRINNRDGDGVYGHVADALERLLDEVTSPEPKLDAVPLLRALDAKARTVEGVRPLLGDSDRVTYYRAKERGWVTEAWADRIACTVLGMPLPLLYGTDYDQEAA